ncbi:MAG: response regulator, partial [Desulfobacterales bacterium]|nr:response regulator [Desulfobacterales bacterium]
VRLFNTSVVQELGCIPLEASNGEEGQQMVAQESPDLIILDVMMPLQSGIRLYRKLKTDAALANIPVIILSGISERSFIKSQEALVAFGENDIPVPAAYLEKPADAETLSAQIKKLIL